MVLYGLQIQLNNDSRDSRLCTHVFAFIATSASIMAQTTRVYKHFHTFSAAGRFFPSGFDVVGHNSETLFFFFFLTNPINA